MAEEIKTNKESSKQAEKEVKTSSIKPGSTERIYTIPLRRHWLNVPAYERTSKAIKTIKKFIAKHMKVSDRDTDKVKLDVYFNNELWFKGRANPPAKIKVLAIKEGDVVKVTFAETPDFVKFLKAKNEKFHTPSKQPEEEKITEKPKEEEKKESSKAEEKEKESSVAELNEKQAKQESKAQKHTAKPEKHKSHPQRMALQK